MSEMCTYDLLRKSVRPKVSGRRALMFLGKPRNARQGKLLHSRFLESVSAGLRVSRLDSENSEASNGRPHFSKCGASQKRYLDILRLDLL